MRSARALAQPEDVAASGGRDGELGESVACTDLTGDSSHWNAISALATEYTNTIRHTFGKQEVDKSGHVEQESESWQDSPAESDPGCHTERSEIWTRPTSAQQSAAANAEVERVAAKILPLNLETEVVVRFDFITNRDSRVGHA